MTSPPAYVEFQLVDGKPAEVRLKFGSQSRTVARSVLNQRADAICRRTHGHANHSPAWADARQEAARQMLIEGEEDCA